MAFKEKLLCVMFPFKREGYVFLNEEIFLGMTTHDRREDYPQRC